MSRRISSILAVLAILALVLPVTAGVALAKESGNVIKTEVALLNPASMNGTQLKPGNYQLTADETKVTLSQNGKVVASAPITWKDDSAKSSYTTVVVADNSVQEIHFSGKTKYVAISR